MYNNKPFILIAEDIESNYLYLNAVLTKLGGKIQWVKNGLEAVNFIKENSDVDLVLMDLQMPVMNGYDATTEIKKLYPDIVVIAQTAFAITNDRELAFSAGCNDYIAKPIKSTDLLSLVHKYLEK